MREYALLLIVVVLFSGNIIVGKIAADALPPFTLALARAAIAWAAATLCFGGAAWRARGLFTRNAGRLFVTGAAGIGLFNALLYAALHSTSTANVAVLEASIPVFTALVMWLFAGERLGARAWLAVLVCAAGAMTVVSRGAPWHVVTQASLGDAVMLCAVAAWIVYAMVGRRALAGMPTFATMVPLAASAFVCLLPLAIAENLVRGIDWTLSPRALACMLYLGLGPSFVAFIIYNRAVVTIGPTAAAVCLNFLPLVTMAGSRVLLGTPILAVQLAGALAVIGGVSLLIVARQREGRAATAG